MDPAVRQVFDSYPEEVCQRLMRLRRIIFELAQENDIGDVEETLKWGEPSYLVRGGSTVRIAWKSNVPDQYAVHFNCRTTLVETFREIYRDAFQFEGNRALVFAISDKVPLAELKHCLLMSLKYHKIKNLPLLGA